MADLDDEGGVDASFIEKGDVRDLSPVIRERDRKLGTRTKYRLQRPQGLCLLLLLLLYCQLQPLLEVYPDRRGKSLLGKVVGFPLRHSQDQELVFRVVIVAILDVECRLDGSVEGLDVFGTYAGELGPGWASVLTTISFLDALKCGEHAVREFV